MSGSLEEIAVFMWLFVLVSMLKIHSCELKIIICLHLFGLIQTHRRSEKRKVRSIVTPGNGVRGLLYTETIQ